MISTRWNATDTDGMWKWRNGEMKNMRNRHREKVYYSECRAHTMCSVACVHACVEERMQFCAMNEIHTKWKQFSQFGAEPNCIRQCILMQSTLESWLTNEKWRMNDQCHFHCKAKYLAVVVVFTISASFSSFLVINLVSKRKDDRIKLMSGTVCWKYICDFNLLH